MDSTFDVLVYQYLPSATISIVNYVLPKIFGELVPLEEYTADTRLIVILARSAQLASFATCILCSYYIFRVYCQIITYNIP